MTTHIACFFIPSIMLMTFNIVMAIAEPRPERRGMYYGGAVVCALAAIGLLIVAIAEVM